MIDALTPRTGACTAPAEHRLPVSSRLSVLAMGAWFRNTVCASHDGLAWISRSVGDLRDVAACSAHETTARALLAALPAPPRAIAHDLHPDFHSTRFGLELAAELGIPAFGIQHHHAHIMAVCAEHGFDAPVIGLALDGVGLGTDGTAWGGELLQVRGPHCTRLGHLRPLAMPGGDRATMEPWRMAAAALHALGRGGEIAARFKGQPAARALTGLLDRGLHCPPSSSMGRVFDAAAGLLGLCAVMQSDAQAAIELENAARRHGPAPALGEGWCITADGQLDLRPLLAWLADCSPIPGEHTDRAAACFHATLGAALAAWLQDASARSGINTVAVGGGCFFNAVLRADLRRHCAAAGLRLLEPRALLPGDSAIAFGQAVIAHHLLEKS